MALKLTDADLLMIAQALASSRAEDHGYTKPRQLDLLRRICTEHERRTYPCDLYGHMKDWLENVTEPLAAESDPPGPVLH